MTREEAEYDEYVGGMTEYDRYDPFGLDGPVKEEPSRRYDDALLATTIARVTWELAKWSGQNDPLKDYAAKVALQLETPNTSRAALLFKVSDSMVRRRVREAQEIIRSGSAFLPH